MWKQDRDGGHRRIPEEKKRLLRLRGRGRDHWGPGWKCGPWVVDMECVKHEVRWHCGLKAAWKEVSCLGRLCPGCWQCPAALIAGPYQTMKPPFADTWLNTESFPLCSLFYAMWQLDDVGDLQEPGQLRHPHCLPLPALVHSKSANGFPFFISV